MSGVSRKDRFIRSWLAMIAVAALMLAPIRAIADIVYFTQSDGIYKIDPATGIISNVVMATAANHINGPAALALGPDGNLYVGNVNNGVIVKVTPGGVASDYNTNVSLTDGLTFDPAGNLYVAQRTSGSVARVPSDGGTPKILALGLDHPQGGMTDPAGNVYVFTNVTLAGQDVVKITPAGVASTFVTGVTGILWDRAENLYLGAAGAITVTPTGGSPSMLASGMTRPFPFGIGSSGDLYVYDGGTKDELLKISPSGTITPIAYLPTVLDIALDVPEPSIALEISLLLLAWTQRRRRCRCNRGSRQRAVF